MLSPTIYKGSGGSRRCRPVPGHGLRCACAPPGALPGTPNFAPARAKGAGTATASSALPPPADLREHLEHLWSEGTSGGQTLPRAASWGPGGRAAAGSARGGRSCSS